MFARVSSYDGPAGLSDEEVEQITKRTLDHLAKLESDDGGSAQAPPTAGVEPVVDRLANVLREAETSARALREDARRESGRVVEEARQEASAIVAEARTRASHVQQQATKALQRSKDAADTFNARWVEYREPLVHEVSDLRERLRVALDSLALMPEPPSTHDEPLIASVEAGAMEELTSAEP